MIPAVCMLSDSALTSELEEFVKTERESTHHVVLHLAEFGRRRLYAVRGYSSLHDYAVRGLKYSQAAAQRRVKAAKVFLMLPETYECLVDGTLTLAVLELVSDALSSSNAKDLLRDVKGKSVREAREVIAHYHPVPSHRLFDKIEPVKAHKITSLRSESSKSIENELEYRVSFTASGELREKLERARELVYSASGDVSLENVLGRALDEFLNKHCPEKRQQRRVEKEQRKAEAKGERIVRAVEEIQEAANALVEKLPGKKPEQSRYIPLALRDAVLARDGQQCTYVAPDGTRCQCRRELQIDHILPYALLGETELTNLRVSCRAHNFLYARQRFGNEYIDEILRRKRAGGLINYVDPAERIVYEVF